MTTLETLKELFINRSDVFSEQSSKGTYSKIERPLTDQDIQDHLDGKKTIGVYQLDKDSNVKWICYDFDGEDLPIQKQLAKNLCMKLRHTDKVESILMEFSGKKGYHIWVFIEPTDATSVKYWAEEACKDYKVHEVFPKQGILDKKKFGNLVKLPLGIHQVVNKRSHFFNEEYKPLDFEQSKEYLKEILNKPKTVIPKVVVKETVRTIIKTQGKTDIPNIVKTLIEKGASEGDRHKNVFIITKELHNAGYSLEEILPLVYCFNNNCNPPKPEYMLEDHVNTLLSSPERYLTQESIVEIPAEKDSEIINIQSEIYQLLLQKDRDKATELLSEAVQEKTKFYATRFDEKSELYYYENGIYIPNGKSFVKEFCRKILAAAYTDQLSNRVISKIETDNYIEQKELLKRHYPNLIACENGILDLETRELTEFTPEKIFLAKIPIKYNPEAECPEINRFFSEIVPEENDVKTLKEWFGYCLRGEYPIQKIGLFIGGGGNGKGQTLELLRKMLGEGNCSAIPLQKLQEMDFKESELFNRFANVGADISDQPLKETSKIKGLSGGDLINASVKFKNDLVFMNESKLIFSANKLPKTYDLTQAFFRRWTYLVFPFDFKTKEEIATLPIHHRAICKIKRDDIIKKILTPEELSGLLNESITGLQRLLEQGDFTSSNTSEETKSWWIKQSDSCLAFCWEELEEAPDESITKNDFRKAYLSYCRKHKIPAEGDKHIHEVLTRQIRAWDSQPEGERIWNGIAFKKEEKQPNVFVGLKSSTGKTPI